jgi:hypothetical protein
METFRVDLLQNTTVHSMHFVLKEDHLFRFVGLVHSHLEFDLVLQKLSEGQSPETLARSTAKNFEDSIFAQLAPGRYRLLIKFVSDEYLMKIPC